MLYTKEKFMNEEYLIAYIEKCKYQRKLSNKTIKAYSTDLKQFYNQVISINNKESLTMYFSSLHVTYKPKTVKRKIASVKAFYHYLEFEEIIDNNPLHKIDVRFKEPILLPKTITHSEINDILITVYKNRCYRDIAIIELLICTGMRVSEICHLKSNDVNLQDKNIRIYGKGNKERILSIDNKKLISALENYNTIAPRQEYFFSNRLYHSISEQSIRFMIKKYTKLAGIDKNITPHMFRHTFATMLLEEEVDIRYIQNILGHSSITTTQIYTHVNNNKQREILTLKNPRNKFSIAD